MAATPVNSQLTAPLPPLQPQSQAQTQPQTLRDAARERVTYSAPLRDPERERAAFSTPQMRERDRERAAYSVPDDSRALQLRAPERSDGSYSTMPGERRALRFRDPERSQGGSFFLASDDHTLAKQIENLHSPDARNINVRPLLRLVEEVIEAATQTAEGHAMVTVNT